MSEYTLENWLRIANEYKKLSDELSVDRDRYKAEAERLRRDRDSWGKEAEKLHAERDRYKAQSDIDEGRASARGWLNIGSPTALYEMALKRVEDLLKEVVPLAQKVVDADVNPSGVALDQSVIDGFKDFLRRSSR